MEVEAKRMQASKARRVILLLDSSKFGQASGAVTLHPRRIDALVTDAQPPAPIGALLKKYDVQLFVASSPLE